MGGISVYYQCRKSITVRINEKCKIVWKVRAHRLKIRLSSKADMHIVKYLLTGYSHEDVVFHLLP